MSKKKEGPDSIDDLKPKMPEDKVRHKHKHKHLTLQDFTKLRLIGKGNVGRVYLVQHNPTGKFYAMKILDKKEMKKRDKVHRVLTEKEILEKLDHPFVVYLHWFFQSKNGLHFVLDFCAGGEFFRFLKRQPRQCIDEKACRFYAAEVLLALEYLHENGCIYRDLKPENILLHISGHIKLSDFDLAKQSSVSVYQCQTVHTKKIIDTFECDLVTNSFVGTTEYMAPEIVNGTSHNFTVDWWTLGILIYEMLFGKTPFVAMNYQDLSSFEKTTQANIKKGSLKFPTELAIAPITKECKSLIKKLLTVDPAKRLGSVAGAYDIKTHPFFKSVPWTNMFNETPPIIPKLSKPDDLVYFPRIKDNYESDEDDDDDDVGDNDEAWKPFLPVSKPLGLEE